MSLVVWVTLMFALWYSLGKKHGYEDAVREQKGTKDEGNQR